MNNVKIEQACVASIVEVEEEQKFQRPKREIVSKLNIKLEDFKEEKHLKKSKTRRFRCLKCRKDKYFTTQKRLDRHLHVAHEEKSEQKLKCEICSKLLKSQVYLKRHMTTRHPEKPKVFICDYDGIIFAAKDYLRIHMDRHKLHQVLTCSICQKSFVSRHTFRRHLKMHIEKHLCIICGLTFSQKILLDNHHASKHTLDFHFKCEYCTRKFPSKTARNNHHYIAHKDKNDQLSFKCNECNIFFEMKEELRIHSFIHFNGEIKTCLECDQIFKTNRLLKIHMQKHENEKSFQCTTCGDLFTFKTGLAKHIRLNRCKGPSSAVKGTESKSDETEEYLIALATKQLNEISKQPRKKVASEQKLERVSEDRSSSDHIDNFFDSFELDVVKKEVEIEQIDLETKETRKSRRQKILPPPIKPRLGRPHLIYTCDFCGAEIKFKKQILNHMKNHTIEKKYSCKECPSTFKSRKKLIDHSIEQHGIKPLSVSEAFACESCNKKFDLKSVYEAHKLSHDENARPFICSVCSAAFKSIGNLHRHEATHILSRNFECSQESCKKKFKTKLALKIHNETVHPEVRVFVNCNVCDTILQEKYLKVHMKNQHTEEGKEKPFCCSICYKAFKTEKLGQRHYEAVHDPKDKGVVYLCPQCPELQFFRQRDLNQHSFIHFEGLIYQCDVCLKMFRTKRLLSIHQSVHNEGAGNFTCKHCENVIFKTRGGRRKHMLRVHTTATLAENPQQFKQC